MKRFTQVILAIAGFMLVVIYLLKSLEPTSNGFIYQKIYEPAHTVKVEVPKQRMEKVYNKKENKYDEMIINYAEWEEKTVPDEYYVKYRLLLQTGTCEVNDKGYGKLKIGDWFDYDKYMAWEATSYGVRN